jgi:hypothetical protein
MSQPFRLPDIPDPPPNHRLRTFTFLFTAFTLVASVGADSYRDGPVGNREHVFTHVRAPFLIGCSALCAALLVGLHSDALLRRSWAPACALRCAA